MARPVWHAQVEILREAGFTSVRVARHKRHPIAVCQYGPHVCMFTLTKTASDRRANLNLSAQARRTIRALTAETEGQTP